MPLVRRRNEPCVNTSIRINRNVSALNTSRKILQKSVNRSILCASSLKSNNASLAKKVAELQMELNVQRSAAREAAIESCRLQMQVARLQPLLEARCRLRENLLQLRELLATMLDTDMAVMRCVNDIASIVDGSGEGADQSVCNTTSWFADTILEMSNLLNVDRTLRDASRVAPSPILPPKRQRPVNRTHDPPLASVPQTLHQFVETSDTATIPHPPIRSLSPPSSPLTANLSNSATDQPVLTITPTMQSLPTNPNPFTPTQPTVAPQTSPVPTHQDSPVAPTLSLRESVPPISANEPGPVSHHSPDPNPPSKTVPIPIPPTGRHHSPTSATHSSDYPAPSIVPIDNVEHQIQHQETVQTTPSESNLRPNCCPEDETVRRVRPIRRAQLNAQPIIDLSASNILDTSEVNSPHEPRTKRRRRLVHADDDDDDGEEATNHVKGPSKAKRTQKPPKKKTEAKLHSVHRPPTANRVVEVQIPKPGRVAFKADAKHAPSTTTLSQTGGNKGSAVAQDAELPKSKSVFDLSANQTINMSVLPPTFNELRQREHAKKEAQRMAESKPTTPAKRNDTVQLTDTNTENQRSVTSPDRLISIVLSPLKPNQDNSAKRTGSRAVLTEKNTNQNTRSFRRLRLVCADDEDDNDVDKKVSSAVHKPSVTKTAKVVVPSTEVEYASKPTSSRSGMRSKRT